jgi:hypothetical protein
LEDFYLFSGGEDTIRKVLDREVRVLGYFDKAGKRHGL